MYLVATEVLADLEELQILPRLFRNAPPESSNVSIPPEVSEKVGISAGLGGDFVVDEAGDRGPFAGRRCGGVDVAVSAARLPEHLLLL